MLDFESIDDRPLVREGITCFRCDSSISVDPPQPEVNFCFCKFECEEPLLQFAGETEREKDYFTLYGKSIDPDYLVKYFINDEEIVDESYGKTLTNGFEVDFTKVFNILGGGDYTLKKEETEWGITKTENWGVFRVAPFSEVRADGTFKIEAFQTGSIENSYDFENENVRFSLRIPGELTNKNPVLEFKDTPDSRRNDIQVHDRFWNEYDLIFDSNKYNFVRLILENMIVGTTIFVSDYGLTNQHKKEPFNRIPLRVEEIDTERVKNTNTTNYVIKMRDALRNGIKHPYIEDC